jgi:hypothetical protein
MWAQRWRVCEAFDTAPGRLRALSAEYSLLGSLVLVEAIQVEKVIGSARASTAARVSTTRFPEARASGAERIGCTLTLSHMLIPASNHPSESNCDELHRLEGHDMT